MGPSALGGVNSDRPRPGSSYSGSEVPSYRPRPGLSQIESEVPSSSTSIVLSGRLPLVTSTVSTWIANKERPYTPRDVKARLSARGVAGSPDDGEATRSYSTTSDDACVPTPSKRPCTTKIENAIRSDAAIKDAARKPPASRISRLLPSPPTESMSDERARSRSR